MAAKKKRPLSKTAKKKYDKKMYLRENLVVLPISYLEQGIDIKNGSDWSHFVLIIVVVFF